jgi:hypothetical protein
MTLPLRGVTRHIEPLDHGNQDVRFGTCCPAACVGRRLGGTQIIVCPPEHLYLSWSS